jgi:hypothetical protein
MFPHSIPAQKQCTTAATSIQAQAIWSALLPPHLVQEHGRLEALGVDDHVVVLEADVVDGEVGAQELQGRDG